MSLSVVIITLNEEANLVRTLQSVPWADEIIVVDSGSTDRTLAVARTFQARVFVETWKGFAGQKNSALHKATGDWILSLDADEEVEPELGEEIRQVLADNPTAAGYWIPRKNFFLGRWIRHGGFYPDPKLRLFRRGAGSFEKRLVHEDIRLRGDTGKLKNHLLHHAYPTLESYLEHMNRYSSLGAEMVLAEKHKRDPRSRAVKNPEATDESAKVLENLNAEWKAVRGDLERSDGYRFSVFNILLRPQLTFFYNYFLRGGFLDGREGFLLHLYHANYVSWKYAKAWERDRQQAKRNS